MVSLAILIDDSGTMNGEWICRDFSDNGESFQSAVTHFQLTRERLRGGVLYQFQDIGGPLGEFSLGSLPRMVPNISLQADRER
jgi:hypothetical protein